MTPAQDTPPDRRARWGWGYRLHDWCMAWISDEKGAPSTKKAGELVVGIVWTHYMLRAAPGSVEMWLAYAGTLLGWSTVSNFLNARNARLSAQQPAK